MSRIRMITLYRELVVILLTTQSVWSMNVTGVDSGENVTILWRIQPSHLIVINNMTVRHGDTGDMKIECFDFYGLVMYGKDCVKYDKRINVVTEPDFIEFWDPFRSMIHAIGFSMTNITLVDAGSYRLRLCCGRPVIDADRHIMYVFNNPEKPIMTGITDPIIGETINITCSADSCSLPEDFHNQSVVMYTWKINNPGNNHFVVNNTVISANVSHDNEGATFSCMANEMNSGLISDSSDLLVLDVYYIEDMNIRLEIINKQTMTAACFVSCHPPCVYHWYDSSGNELSEGQQVSVPYGENYTCTAQNQAGKLSTTIPYVTGQTTSAVSGTTIGLAVIIIVILAATVTLAVLYIQRLQLDRSQGGSTDPTTNRQVYVNTSFMENLEASTDGNSSLSPEGEPPQPSVFDGNYSSLSGEREPQQTVVYDELSTGDSKHRGRSKGKQIYENVAQDSF